QEVEVLFTEWTVESEAVTQSRDIAGGSGFAEHRNDRVARHQVNHRKGEGHDTDRDWYHRGEAAQKKPRHRGASGAKGATRVTRASERRLPLGYGSKPATSRFSTVTFCSHHRETYGRSSAARPCTRP